MTRSLVSLAALLCLAAPAFADVCTAATEAATRAALDSAEATGRRTATVRVTCDGERKTFVLHRTKSATGTSVTVRELKRSADKSGLAGGKATSGGASMTKIIRVGD
jgi:hypothetical protein